ncbi:dnaJ domain-containing protein [Ditylenchus destructor]|nr:dnaJ domain-containing protein [Ditylenchus destructor]
MICKRCYLKFLNFLLIAVITSVCESLGHNGQDQSDYGMSDYNVNHWRNVRASNLEMNRIKRETVKLPYTDVLDSKNIWDSDEETFVRNKRRTQKKRNKKRKMLKPHKELRNKIVEFRRNHRRTRKVNLWSAFRRELLRKLPKGDRAVAVKLARRVGIYNPRKNRRKQRRRKSKNGPPKRTHGSPKADRSNGESNPVNEKNVEEVISIPETLQSNTNQYDYGKTTSYQSPMQNAYNTYQGAQENVDETHHRKKEKMEDDKEEAHRKFESNERKREQEYKESKEKSSNGNYFKPRPEEKEPDAKKSESKSYEHKDASLDTSSELSLYKILEVQEGASSDDIKRAFRKKALLNHPDKVHPNNEEEKDKINNRMALINRAKEVLLNSRERRAYDWCVKFKIREKCY